MTEQEWLTCTNPAILELCLSKTGRLSNRKSRLFGCACVREVWTDLPNDTLRDATITCEKFADGDATTDELSIAMERADSTYYGVGDVVADHSALAITGLCGPGPHFPMGSGSVGGIVAVMAELNSNEHTPWDVAFEQARQKHCELMHDIYGNPFRPVALDSHWQSETVVALAAGIYADRAFDRMPILADALEEAGCDHADILNHCRGNGPHVRGCWVVDLLLGKE